MRKIDEKHKSRHDWLGMVIFKEQCKLLTFDHFGQGFKHYTDTVLKNEKVNTN